MQQRLLSLVLSVIFLGVLLFIVLQPQLPVTPLVSDQIIDLEDEYEKLRLDNLKQHVSFYVSNKTVMKPVPLEWTTRDRCPACFGTDMCVAIERQEVVVEIPKIPTPANKKGVYLGQWLDIPVAVKRLSKSYRKEFKLFDKFICQNTTGSKACNVSAAIVSNHCFVQNNATYSPENLHHAWKVSYPEYGADALTYALCITPLFSTKLSDLYDDDNDDELTPEQRAILFTSMVVQPESLILRFLNGNKLQRIAPKIYGACGRLIVVEHSGRLLASYLNESFVLRVELALQLLSLVQVFWRPDRQWFAVFRNFVYENIAVSHEKDIFIINYEDLSIIEKVDDEANDEDQKVTCNDACFNKLYNKLKSDKLSVHERQDHCNSLHSVGGSLMYSTLCRNILSDIAEHRAVADKDGASYRGLLHSIPEHERKKDVPSRIRRALHDCVEEKKPGGRLKAVNMLADLLSQFVIGLPS